MTKVALSADSVNDLLAAPLRDEPLGNTRLTLLVVLVAAAMTIFQALRIVLAGLLAMLLSALALLRSFVLVVALAGVIGYSLFTGSAEAPADEEPGGSAPSPTAVQTPSPNTPPPVARPARPTPHR